jgi:hypothetical protein
MDTVTYTITLTSATHLVLLQQDIFPFCTFLDSSQTFQARPAKIFNPLGKIFTGPQFNTAKRVGERFYE